MNNIISGRVVRGDGYGRKIGFPTANLDRKQFVRLQRKPKLGIYAGIATVGTRRYKAASVVGPIDKKGLPKLEAHLIGFNGNLYGKRLRLELAYFIRPFDRYTTERALIAQIKKDVAQVIKLIQL